MNTYIKNNLEQLKEQNLYRQLHTVSSPQGREIVLNGQRVLNFCSNDYLGLAADERIKDAAKQAIDQYGFGGGASRLVCGNTVVHETLEKNLAHLKKTEAALTFASGYMANGGIVPAIVGRNDIVFSDRLNHASIIDGIVLSRATMKRYPHGDMDALEVMLKNAPTGRRKLVVTDTVFSMDGDVAPLKDLVDLARQYEAILMVDEAHAFGVLGKDGAGLAEELGLSARIDIHMGTLSKAAGCSGAYVCGTEALRNYMINHARSFIYTTAMPPAAAAAAHCAVNIIRDEPARRLKLEANADHVRRRLQALGLNTLNSTTPIIPVVIGSAHDAVALSQRLLAHHIFVQAIRPPTVPVKSARLRVTVMATHTPDDLDQLINALQRLI